MPNRRAQLFGVRAVEIATGRVLWQKQTDYSEANGYESTSPMLVGVYCDVTVLVRGRYDRRRIDLVRTDSGQILNPSRSTDKALLQKAIAAQGWSVIPVTIDWTLSLLHLDIGNFTPLDLPFEDYEGFGVQHGCILIGQNKAGTLITEVSDESDVTGSSVNPKYILAVDQQGHRRWQLPNHLLKSYQDGNPKNYKRNVYPVQWIPDADVFIARNGEEKTFGVSASNGRRLWAGLPPNFSQNDVAAYRGGMFSLSDVPLPTLQERATGHRSPFTVARELAYIDARTGRLQRLERLQGNFGRSYYDFSALTADGDDLLVADGSSVRVFSCRSLLSLLSVANPERTPNR